MFLTSKLIKSCIDTFTSEMKSQSIASLLSESTHTYIEFWTLRRSALNMGFVDKWPSKIQEQWFFRSWTGLTEVFGGV